MLSKRSFILIYLLLLSAVSRSEPSVPVHDFCSGKDEPRRCLAGHLFVLPYDLNSAFLTSNMATFYTGKFPRIALRDSSTGQYKLYRAKGQNIGYLLEFLALDWLSVGAMTTVELTAGDGKDFVQVGYDRAINGALNAKFKLVQNERLMLSTSVQFQGSYYDGVNPSVVAGRVINTVLDRVGKATFEGIQKDVENDFKYMLTERGEIGLKVNPMFAYGINSMLGFFGGMDYTLKLRSKNFSDLENNFSANLGVSTDLNPHFRVPVGVLFFTRWTYQTYAIPRSFEQNSGIFLFNLGLFYTGSRNFSVGLEFNDHFTPIFLSSDTGNIRTHSYAAQVSLRYYWN